MEKSSNISCFLGNESANGTEAEIVLSPAPSDDPNDPLVCRSVDLDATLTNVRIDVADVAKMPQLCPALGHVCHHLDFVRTESVEHDRA